MVKPSTRTRVIVCLLQVVEHPDWNSTTHEEISRRWVDSGASAITQTVSAHGCEGKGGRDTRERGRENWRLAGVFPPLPHIRNGPGRTTSWLIGVNATHATPMWHV